MIEEKKEKCMEQSESLALVRVFSNCLYRLCVGLPATDDTRL